MRNLRVLASLLLTRSFFWSYCKVGLRVVSKQLLFSFFVVPGRGGGTLRTRRLWAGSALRAGEVSWREAAARFGECVVFAEPALRVASPLHFLEILGGALGRGMCPVFSGNRLPHLDLPARRGWRPPVFGVAGLRLAFRATVAQPCWFPRKVA